jgi:hypothetical protein
MFISSIYKRAAAGDISNAAIERGKFDFPSLGNYNLAIDNEGHMRRETVNRIAANTPPILSLSAFALVLMAVATGWGQAPGDEGAAARIFQLLIVAQLPFIVTYIMTANWRRRGPALARIALQVAALALAFAPVAYFHL